MPYAKIANGRVVSLHESIPTLPPKACALFVECAEGTQVGWAYTPEGCVDASFDDSVESIETKYLEGRAQLEKLVLGVILNDGEDREEKLTAIAEKHAELLVRRNEAYDELFNQLEE